MKSPQNIQLWKTAETVKIHNMQLWWPRGGGYASRNHKAKGSAITEAADSMKDAIKDQMKSIKTLVKPKASNQHQALTKLPIKEDTVELGINNKLNDYFKPAVSSYNF